MAKETKEPEAPEEEPLVVVEESEDTEEIEVPADYRPPKGVKVEKEEEPDEDEGVPLEYKGKSKAELSKLLKEREARAEPNVSEGLKSLADAIMKTRAGDVGHQDPTQQKQGESDEDFWKRMGVEVFDEKTMPKAFSEAVNRNPRMARLAMQNMILNKRLLRQEEKELFTSYGDEIEKEAQALIRQYGPDAEVYDVAVRNVKALHAEDIAGAKQADKVKQLEARIAELESGTNGSPAKQAQAQAARAKIPAGGGSSIGGAAAASGKRKIKITDEIRREAGIRGMTVRDYLGLEEEE